MTGATVACWVDKYPAVKTLAPVISPHLQRIVIYMTDAEVSIHITFAHFVPLGTWPKE